MEASLISSYREISRDYFKVSFVQLTLRRSIRASRKRKLHEVYCVATQVDALPLVDPIAESSQLTNAEESKFHNDNAVLQYAFYIYAAPFKDAFSPQIARKPN